MSRIRNYKRIMLIIASLSFAFTKVAYADDPTQKDNYFCVVQDPNKNNVPIDFKQYDYGHDATDIYSWGGITQVDSGKYAGCIDVKASQDISTLVTDWVWSKLYYNNIIPSWDGNYMTATDGYDDTKPPEELAFAIFGDLTINAKGVTYTCKNVIIGQGKHNHGHNWWVFNNNADRKHSLKCENDNNTVYLNLGSDEYNKYTINFNTYTNINGSNVSM